MMVRNMHNFPTKLDRTDDGHDQNLRDRCFGAMRAAFYSQQTRHGEFQNLYSLKEILHLVKFLF